MNVDYKLIGARIKEKRRTYKYTQEKLAEILDVSVGYISQLERGATKINLDTLGHIANIFNCDIADFLFSSNTAYTKYLSTDLEYLFSKLTQEERAVLFELLKTYLHTKSN